MAVFTDYLVSFIAMRDGRVSRRPARMIWGLVAVAIGMLVISQFNHMYYVIDENNLYRRQGWFWLSQAFGIACMLANAWLLIRHRKKLSTRGIWSFSLYIALPVAAMTAQLFIYDVPLLNLSSALSALCIYLGVQVNRARQLSEKQLELERSRTQLMLSQIQPHFLFNTLNAIYDLCVKDPEEARAALLEFSHYLRANTDSLANEGPIRFEKELEHTENYLALEKRRFEERLLIEYDICAQGFLLPALTLQPILEKRRFEERLLIEYDICAQGFLLPALTLQPIVENAVRHGVTKREGGGTVRIAAEEKADGHLLTVSDDGIGFDPAAPLETDRPHIGIANVRERLRQQCGGTVTVQSAPGGGTTVSLFIPRRPL